MTWYSASIIIAIRATEGKQDVFPAFENFYLINAKDREHAISEAERFGRELENIDDNLTLDGAPAERKFLGIRKLRSIYNPPEIELDNVPPVHGTEISHSFFELRNEADLKKLASGKRLSVDYVDDDE